LAATFQRLSLTPTWSWNNCFLDGKRSGGAMLDLHIHDADYIQYVFGMPKAVFSQGVLGPSKDYDHCVTQYLYDNESVITAEGGWIMAPSFGFEMSYKIMLEEATLIYSSAQQLTDGKPSSMRIHPKDGEIIYQAETEGDGYFFEIKHFVENISGKKIQSVITPEQSRDSVNIIEAEKESIKIGEKILIS
jgi:predicted dehydrogenase